MYSHQASKLPVLCVHIPLGVKERHISVKGRQSSMRDGYGVILYERPPLHRLTNSQSRTSVELEVRLRLCLRLFPLVLGL
jgi:hypothetical protein